MRNSFAQELFPFIKCFNCFIPLNSLSHWPLGLDNLKM